MSAFSTSTVNAHREHIEAKLAYAQLLGVNPEELSCTRADDKFLGMRKKALLVLEPVIAKENLNTVDALGTVLAMGTVVLFMVFNLHQLVGWWLLLVLLTAIFGGAVVFRRVATTHFTPALHELLAARSASERTYAHFMGSLESGLKASGLKILEIRTGYRYVTNHGVATIVTIDGELDFLLNGKVVQRPYRDLYAV